MTEQETQERAVLRLRAEGVSYRKIATQLGIPLTRSWELAKQGLGPEPLAPGESEEGLSPGASEAEAAAEMVQGAAPIDVPPQVPPPAPVPAGRPAVVERPVEVVPVPAGAVPSPGGVGFQLLTGPSTMPTPAQARQPYPMPAPGGGTYLVGGLEAMGTNAPPAETPAGEER